MSDDTTFITPGDTALLLIDYQPQMLMGLRSDDPASVLDNAQIPAKAARLFEMPTVLTTITADSFAGPFVSEIARDVFPGKPVRATSAHGRGPCRYDVSGRAAPNPYRVPSQRHGLRPPSDDRGAFTVSNPPSVSGPT